ncbi:MAG: redox-regulated ATPase YchF [bacterium]
MSLSIGIVGLPNVGKSTLFKALTKKQVAASNFPFCTIDPNIGIVNVPDKRLEKLADISKSAKIVPTTVKFVDIAGLVAGAHKGEGLGNKFLANIREVDAICHIIRGFSDPNVVHVAGKVDPKSDMEIINLELIFADMSVAAKRLENLKKEMRSGDKHATEINAVLEKVMKTLENGHFAADAKLDDDEKFLIKELSLLTLKPILYVANVNEEDIGARDLGISPSDENRSRSQNIVELQSIGKAPLINISAKIESELAELSEEDAKEYMRELGISQSGLDKLIIESYKLLNLITFFTSGEPETRAWTVAQEAKAPAAAGVIHTDFEEKFIRAEAVSYDDFVLNNGWNGAKEKGLMRLEGKDYVVQDGDVMFFRHGA